MRTIRAIAVISSFVAMSVVAAPDNMKAFPPAEAGMVRYVLQVPKQEDETAFIRYNSRLPVVVYAPEGAEVRYRIWSAPPETKAIGKG
jgi:serine protease inhibitor ecotin